MKKININRNELLRVLSEGGVFAGRNRAITALNNIRVTTKDGRIRVESSSDNNYIKVYGVCLDGTEDMNFCISPKEITTYLKFVADPEVSLTYDEEKSVLKVKHSHGSTKTPTYDPKEFPIMNVQTASDTNVLPANILTTWLNTAQKFIMAKNIGTALGGVNLRATEGKLTVVGADSGLIYMSDCTFDAQSDFNVTIPEEGAKVMATMCAGATEVELSMAENAIVIKNADFALYARLVDVKYPALHRLAGHKGQTCFTVNATSFRQAVNRIISQTAANENRIKITINANELVMCYDYPQAGKHVEEVVTCDCPNFETQVTVDVNYLLMALTNIIDEDIVFYHDDNERSPFFFESVGENFTSVILLGTMV